MFYDLRFNPRRHDIVPYLFLFLLLNNTFTYIFSKYRHCHLDDNFKLIFIGKPHKHRLAEHHEPKPKEKEKSHKSEHHKSKSEHEHAKQTLKLLKERQHTPIALRLKQQVQQHTGHQKHILPVVPKKVPAKPRPAALNPLAKSTRQHPPMKTGIVNRPKPRIRIVYVPTNQSAEALIRQGPINPFYKKPIGKTPFIGAVKSNPSAMKQRPVVSNQPAQPPRAKANVHQTAPLGKRPFAKPVDTARIFKQYPQLRASGVTDEILKDLYSKVPNLEDRIQAHFNSHKIKPALYTNSVHHDLAASNVAFMKNYHDALQSQQFEGFLKNNNKFESNAGRVGMNMQDVADLSSLTKGVKNPNNAGTIAANRMQTLALQNFQNNFFKQNSGSKNPNQQASGYLSNSGGPSLMSLQRFRQENVPENSYKTGNFEKQTSQPGIVFLPGEQLTAYGYNKSISRGILPQPIKYPWQSDLQTNRLSAFYSNNHYVNTWTAFTTCSSTCGRGMKKRYRKCGIPDCPSGGVEIETVPCITRPCAGLSLYFKFFSLI